jgi:O-acetyl-ADP-ribose deacetylase (regulator of RNase III)
MLSSQITPKAKIVQAKIAKPAKYEKATPAYISSQRKRTETTKTVTVRTIAAGVTQGFPDQTTAPC